MPDDPNKTSPAGQQTPPATPPVSGGSATPPATPPSGEGSGELISMSAAEFERRLQSEADRRVNQALETAKAKWKQEFEKTLDAERREAERLAKLSDEDRQKALDEKLRKQLEDRERELSRKEMKLEAVNILAEKTLPVTFADLLIGPTAEETQQHIKDFETAFRSAVEAEVNKRLKGTTPKGGAAPGSAGSTSKVDMNALIRGSVRGGRR